MLEYVKVLLCMYPKLERDAAELGRAMEYRALRSYCSTRSCEEIAEELIALRDRAAEYRAAERALTALLEQLPRGERAAIGFRFFREPMPTDATLRTIYRRSVRAVGFVAEGLERAGFTKDWFFSTCRYDGEMMFRYRYYRSQIPYRCRKEAGGEVRRRPRTNRSSAASECGE